MNWWIILCLILLITLIAEHISHVKQTNQAKEDEDSYYKDIIKRRDEIYELQDKVYEFKNEYNQSQKELEEAYDKIVSLNEEIESLQEKVKKSSLDFATDHIISPITGNIEYMHMGFGGYPHVLDEEEAYILERKIENEMFKALRDSLLSSLTAIEVHLDPASMGHQVICEIPIVKKISTSSNDLTVNPEEKYPIVNAIEKIKRGNVR